MNDPAFVSQRRAKQLFPHLSVSYWSACGLVPKNKKGNLCLAYLQRLSRHTKGIRLSRTHVQLRMLEWQNTHEPEARTQVAQEAIKLVNSGAVFTLRETAKLVGYSKDAVHAWEKTDFLVGALLPHPDIRIKRVWVYVRSDVFHAKQILDSLTKYEAANLLEVSPRQAVVLAQSGRVKATQTPSGWRFSQKDIEAYLQAQRQSSGLPQQQATAFLGVTSDVFYPWVQSGVIHYTLDDTGGRLYDFGSLQKAKVLREAIHGGFDWYPADIADPTYPTKVVARKTSVTAWVVASWAEAGLLPFFNLRPPSSDRKRLSHRLYPSAYVDAFVDFAVQHNQQPSKQLARAFKEHMRQKLM